MKKTAILIVLFLILACMTVPAAAETEAPEEFRVGNFRCILNEDLNFEIIGYVGMDSILAVPDTLDGHAVTEIGHLAFVDNNSLTEVTLPEGLKAIGDKAFSGCSQLRKIQLPDSLESIGSYEFGGCVSLAEIKLPAGLLYIGANPFAGTTPIFIGYLPLDDLKYEVVDGALFDKADARLIYYPPTKPENEYSVPQGTRIIGEYAFYGCNLLDTVLLPDSLETISEGAFYMCESLSKITLPKNLKTIGYSAFAYDKMLTELTLPESLQEIDGTAFYGCDQLDLYVFSDSYAQAYADGIGSRYFVINPDD